MGRFDMKKLTYFRDDVKRKCILCAFPYAVLKAFIPVHFLPSETHFTTGFE